MGAFFILKRKIPEPIILSTESICHYLNSTYRTDGDDGFTSFARKQEPADEATEPERLETEAITLSPLYHAPVCLRTFSLCDLM